MKLFERVEKALEKRNRYDLATGLRGFEMHFVSSESKRIQNKWRNRRRKESRKGFSILQREIYLKEEVEALLKVSRIRPLSTEEGTELKAWEKELEGFDQEYWIHKRAWHKLTLEKPKGPWVREWDASYRRSAILSPKQRSLCIGRGGCCERECGCCERDLKTHREKNKYGHCTMECGCCIRARGFYKPDLKTWASEENL
jgi:hypothetical protein